MYGNNISYFDEWGNLSLYDYLNPEEKKLFIEELKMENLINTISETDNLNSTSERDKFIYRILFYVFETDFTPNEYTDKGTYVSSQDYLPEEDLTFTMFTKASVTRSQSLERILMMFYYFILFVFLGLIILLVLYFNKKSRSK